MTKARIVAGTPAWTLAPTVLLLAAELTWLMAMLGFGRRVGELPMSGAMLGAFALAIGLGMASVAGWWRGPRRPEQGAWLALLPMWALVIYGLGIDGPYTPYGHFDWEDTLPWLYLPTLLTTAVVGTLRRDPRMLGLGAALPLAGALYLSLRQTTQGRCGLPPWDDARCLGNLEGELLLALPGPVVAVALTCALFGVAVALGGRLRGDAQAPATVPLWLASAAGAAVGGLMQVFGGLAYLPSGGEELGWMEPALRVPADAWGPASVLADGLARASVAAAGLLLLLRLGRLALGLDRAREAGVDPVPAKDVQVRRR